MEYFYREPRPGISFESRLTIAVHHDSTPLNPGKLGNLKAMSPEEPRHALIFAIARDIDSGMSDEQLMPWKVLITSAILTFQKVDNEEDIFWHATNARESLGAQYEVVYFSSVTPPACWNTSRTYIWERCLHTHIHAKHNMRLHCRYSASSSWRHSRTNVR